MVVFPAASVAMIATNQIQQIQIQQTNRVQPSKFELLSSEIFRWRDWKLSAPLCSVFCGSTFYTFTLREYMTHIRGGGGKKKKSGRMGKLQLKFIVDYVCFIFIVFIKFKWNWFQPLPKALSHTHCLFFLFFTLCKIVCKSVCLQKCHSWSRDGEFNHHFMGKKRKRCRHFEHI